MKCTEIEDLQDCEVVYVHGAKVSNLVQFLDRSIPWVWILGHSPNSCMQWWETAVPVTVGSAGFAGSVRNLCFDLQMTTADFLSRARDFDAHGLLLIQSHHKMPDTLCPERIHDAQQNRVLIQNGATLKIYLPHADETAMVQSYVRGHLAMVISR